MRRPIVDLVKRHSLPAGLVAAALLCGGISAWSQVQSKKSKSADATAPAGKKEETKRKAAKAAPTSLEEMLTQALRNNPDIRLAATKVREADAELQRTRLQVTQKVVTLYHAREVRKAKVKTAEDQVAALRNPQEEGARQNVIDAKAELAMIEAEIAYVLGNQPAKGYGVAFGDFDNDGRLDLAVVNYLRSDQQVRQNAAVALTALARSQLQAAKPAVAGTMADKIRKALDAPVRLKVQKAALGTIVQSLQENAGITIEIAEGENLADAPLTGLNLKDVPLGAALQAIEDKFTSVRPDARQADMEYPPGVRVAVRAYGLLIVSENRLPPGAVLMEDFWKGHVGKDKAEGEVRKKAAH
jgi:hypothetical protein